MYTTKGQLNREDMLRQYVPLVRRLAHYMIAKLPPSVEVDDLIQVGMIGLADAMSRFESSQGVQFETFATQRIRGAMLDELRETDWMSRGSRKSQKDIEHAVVCNLSRERLWKRHATGTQQKGLLHFYDQLISILPQKILNSESLGVLLLFYSRTVK